MTTIKNVIEPIFNIVNTKLMTLVEKRVVQDDGTVVLEEKLEEVRVDGKVQYSKNNNIKLSCSNDANFNFPQELSISILKSLTKDTKVSITEGTDYVVYSRNGKKAEISRPRKGGKSSGKLLGCSSLLYMPKVRGQQTKCAELANLASK